VLRTSLSGSITGLLKSGIGVSVLVVGAIHHSPGGCETRPIGVTVCAGLSISMWSDGPLDEVWLNEVGFGKTICRGTMVG
jgi:hypothetical protein